MYIETSSPRVKGDVARFVSGEYQQMSGDECVTFYYHMYGKDTGTLNVYQFDGKYTQGRLSVFKLIVFNCFYAEIKILVVRTVLFLKSQ